MTFDDIKNSYSQLAETEKTNLTIFKRQIFRIGTLRLFVVVACVALCYYLWGNMLAVIADLLVGLIIFMCLAKYHNKLFAKKKYAEIIINNAENELKGLNYDFTAFDGANEMVDSTHSFSYDLDLFGNRSFFQSINRTVTEYGKNALIKTFVRPFDTKLKIIDRQQAIKELSTKNELITRFRAKGMMVEDRNLDIKNFPKQFNYSKPISTTFWRFMPFIAPVLFFTFLGLCIANVSPFAVWTVVTCWSILLILSLIPFKYIQNKVSLITKKVDTLKAFATLFRMIESEKFDSPRLLEIQQTVSKNDGAAKAINQLDKLSNNLDQSFSMIGSAILNPIFFWNVIYTLKIEKWITKHEEDLDKWFDALAEFDSLISLGLFAYNHADYVYPQVADKFQFEAKGLGHPLINKDLCVRNDLSVSRRAFFIVVTGANMAGKSTYLRTVGINHVLACTGAPVCAESMTFYPCHLVTNLRTSDSLNDNESYFFAELKRLKMIIDRLQLGEELFIILDEILKGTNSEDKEKGSIALIKQLISFNSNGIIATHDLLLGNLEQEFPDNIKNYCFEADIKNDHLSFSYKIREGIAQNMNACFLMKKMGITGL